MSKGRRNRVMYAIVPAAMRIAFDRVRISTQGAGIQRRVGRGVPGGEGGRSFPTAPAAECTWSFW